MVTMLPYTSTSTPSQACSATYNATAANILNNHQMVSYRYFPPSNTYVDKIGMRTSTQCC